MIPVAVLLENDRRLFLKYQPYLLKAANTKIGRLFFGLTQHPATRAFVGIFENAVAWQEENGQVSLEFLPTNQYANRLRYLLRVLRLFPLALIPRLEAQALFAAPLFVGASMTFNPSASAISGYAQRFGGAEAWATKRAGAGTGVGNGTIVVAWMGSNVLNQWNNIYRGFCLFDTSIIGSGSTIASATFQPYIFTTTNPSDATTRRDIHLAAASPVSDTTIASSDFSNVSTTSFGSLAWTSIVLNYNTITLNASGLSAISKTGITKFSLQTSADLSNSAPNHNGTTGDQLIAQIYGYPGGNLPKLNVTLSAVGKTLTDALSLADTTKRTATHTLADTLTLADPAVTTFKGAFRELLETVTMSDSVRKAEMTKELLETITMADPTVRSFFLNIVESIALSDSPVVRGTAKVILNVLSHADSVTARLLWTRRSKPTSTWTNRTKPPGSWS